jgi:hypothetical protein
MHQSNVYLRKLHINYKAADYVCFSLYTGEKASLNNEIIILTLIELIKYMAWTQFYMNISAKMK